MNTEIEKKLKRLEKLEAEMANLESIAIKLEPDEHDIPEVDGLDIYGKSIELNGAIGGDHIIFMDYQKRFDLERLAEAIKNEKIYTEAHKAEALKKVSLNYKRCGIFMADVQGHDTTDSLVHAGLHQTLLALLERDMLKYGELTKETLEDLNDRAVASTSIEKMTTAILAEVSNTGIVRMIIAGNEEPYTFSYERNELKKVPDKYIKKGEIIGLMPTKGRITKPNGHFIHKYKEPYEVSEIKLLSPKDILILYTDGFSDHNKYTRRKLAKMEEEGVKLKEEEYNYVKEKLQNTLTQVKDLSAKEIYEHIKKEILAYGKREDDISYIIIKRTK